MSASSGIESTAELTQVIPLMPFFWSLALNRVAPKALEPIPASQAKTIFLTSPGRVGRGSEPSLSVAASSSPWKSGFAFIIGMASRKEIAVPMRTPSMPMNSLPLGDIKMMEIRLPGEAGATSPNPVNVKNRSEQMLPVITARSSTGLAKT